MKCSLGISNLDSNVPLISLIWTLSGLPQGQRLWGQQTWVWQSPPGGGPINPTIEPPELTQDWEMNAWRAQTEPCVPGRRRKDQWSHKRLTQTCLWVSRSLWRRRGSSVPCCRAGGTECSVQAWDLLKEVTIIFIISTIVWPQVYSRVPLHGMAYSFIELDNAVAHVIRLVESSDKMWSTGEGNGKLLQYSCLENPINGMKGKKIVHWKVNSPGW